MQTYFDISSKYNYEPENENNMSTLIDFEKGEWHTAKCRRLELNMRPLRQGLSLITWDARSTRWTIQAPHKNCFLITSATDYSFDHYANWGKKMSLYNQVITKIKVRNSQFSKTSITLSSNVLTIKTEQSWWKVMSALRLVCLTWLTVT